MKNYDTSSSRAEFKAYAKEHRDEFVQTALQQGAILFSGEAEAEPSFDYEVFSFRKFCSVCDLMKRLGYREGGWHNQKMMPLTSDYDAEFDDETDHRQKIEFKLRFRTLHQIDCYDEPQGFVPFEDKYDKIRRPKYYVKFAMMFFWLPGQDGKVEWAYWRLGKNDHFQRNVPMKDRRASAEFGDGVKEYPADGFYLCDAERVGRDENGMSV